MSQLAFFEKYCNSDFQSKLLDGMNALISDMKNGKNKKEKQFVSNLRENLKKIKFLTFKNKKIEIKKENHQKGGSTDDEKFCKNTGQMVTSMPPSNETNTLSILQRQMEQLSNELSIYRLRPDADQSQVAARQNQLTHMAMAIEAVRQRQQAIDIVQRRENWSRTGDICNSLLSLTFTGLAGYLSYLVVTLFEGAATFITTGATGIFMLFCISIFQVFISIINGVGTSIPSWMGGGNIVTMSGRDLANNITSAISNGITDTPELSRLQELGYTTKMIAFMILFVMFMIITHIIRIFMTARQFSVGWTGISVGDGRQPLQNISTPVQVPQLTNRNTQDQQSNTNLRLPDINGGKKRKTKKNKKNKKKTKKAKKSKKKKNKKSKKTKKARKKRR
jgi:hypothetical protein